MKTMTTPSVATNGPFVDAHEATYTMNRPMHDLTNTAQEVSDD
ncbi:hypothetical protein SAMN04515620_11361 [Collimonas sp. OK607]|nr:hypothetical protein [Collimonas sp. OK607]SFB02903.1 hypothetical protein SAMN04515620_11361 [Collimonas sp. OK607]